MSAAERDNLLAMPDAKDELILHYALVETDLPIIHQHRGPANRLGFAVQSKRRFAGIFLGADESSFPSKSIVLASAFLRTPATTGE